MTEKVQAGSAQRQVSQMLPTNLHQQALMGRACHMSERQQVDQMCDSGVHETTHGLGVIQKDVGGMTLKRL